MEKMTKLLNSFQEDYLEKKMNNDPKFKKEIYGKYKFYKDNLKNVELYLPDLLRCCPEEKKDLTDLTR